MWKTYTFNPPVDSAQIVVPHVVSLNDTHPMGASDIYNLFPCIIEQKVTQISGNGRVRDFLEEAVNLEISFIFMIVKITLAWV